MRIERVYLKADIDKSVEDALDTLDKLKSSGELPYAAYNQVFDAIALINDVIETKTYVVEIRPQYIMEDV